MCYIPKATFYVYFFCFFCGYVWIFGLLLYQKVWQQSDRRFKASSSGELSQGSIMNDYSVSSLQYDLTQELPIASENFECVQMRTKPMFSLCIHDSTKDRGISAHVRLFRQWEPEITNFIVEFLSRDPLSWFLDIGANIGFYSVLAAKLGHNVLAIEPFLDNIVRLHKAVITNQLSDRIVVIRAAVSDQRTNMTFVDPLNNFGGRFAVPAGKELDYFTANKLYALSIFLDDLVTFLPNQSSVVMKMDIQGHECHALQRSEKLFSHVRVIALVTEWSELRQSSETACVRKMLRYLHSKKFDAFTLDKRHIDNLLAMQDAPSDIAWFQRL